MPDAIITSTESTFGTISGTFSADQSTITGTVSGIITGTLSGSVGVPGPQGEPGAPGVGIPAGGTTGQYLVKASGTSYDTAWSTISSGATEAWVTANFYPLTGNPSGFLTSSALTGYATQAWVDAQGYLQSGALTGYAPLASPALTGTPTAPTATLGDDSTQIATTAFVQDAIIAGSAHAETLVATVRNATGATLAAGTVVYINGALGNRATVAKAQANAEATSAGTFAVVETPIANNADGVVVITGVLSNQDTSAYADGDKLYLSPTVAGGVTTTKPSAPNHLVYVATVTRAHPTQGTMEVRIQNGYELGEIHDVAIASVADNDLLAYNSSTGLWNNESFSTLGLLTSATAASTYQTLSGMSSYLTTASAASTYQTQAGMSSYLTTASAATTYAALSGATFTGKVNTVLSATGGAGFNLPHGAAPTTPVNGDIWTTTSGTFARINGGTQQYAPLGSTNTFTGTNTFSGATVSFGTSTAASTINIGTGATLTATTKAVNIGTAGVAGSTTNIAIGSATSTTTTTVEGTVTLNGPSLNLGNSTATGTVNVASAATISGATKSVNVATGGALGSTTNLNLGGVQNSATSNIKIGDTVGTYTVNIYGTTALNGSTTTSTAAVDTNSTALATTAFVVGQAGSATPLVDGTAAVGTSLRYARQDHVHPTDTSRAALASPTFTGTPSAPTAAVDTNTTQIATTAFVIGQGYLKSATASSTYAPLASPALTGTPTSTTAAVNTNTTQIATTAFVLGQANSTAGTIAMDGTQAAGTSNLYARADHVHPTDTSRAPLASPTFTGTPSLPTGTIAVTQSAGNNTTAVATTAFVTAAVPSFSTVAQSRSATSTTVTQNPSTNLWQTMNPGLLYIANAGLSYTATGTMGTSAQGWYGCRMTMGTSGAASGNWRISGSSFDSGFICFSKSYRSYIDFSRYIRVSGRFYTEDNWADPQLTGAVYFGKAANSANGDLARAGFGWKVSGNATASLRNPVLQVHNGTTLTNVTGSFAMVAQQYFDWDIISDGTGNVTLYINGSQVATTTAGPTADTSYSGTSPIIWSAELITTGTTAAYNATYGRGAIYMAQ